MDWHALYLNGYAALAIVLLATASNGWADAPCSSSAAVASGALISKEALKITAKGNFFGLLIAFVLGAKVAQIIGTGIVRPDIITIPSISIALLTNIIWTLIVLWLGFAVSKTHSLLAALAGIGHALGGWLALWPASGNWQDSGWVLAAEGMAIAIFVGLSASWFLTNIVIRSGLAEKIPDHWWRRLQRLTVWVVATGHGFGDGLKYVGIFTLVLLKGGAIPEFEVKWWVILLDATFMSAGTLLGGWRIHRRLDTMVNGSDTDTDKRTFQPYMGVVADLVSGFLIWQTSWLGMPTSTNHATVSAMAGAKSALGKIHMGSVRRIWWGWIVTYVFNFFVAKWLTTLFLL